MRKIRNLPRAEADIIEIWSTTSANWGAAQADAYLDDIGHAVAALSNYPNLGVDCSWIRTGYRRLAVKHHHIYYLVSDDYIDIVRVLHERMDAASAIEE